jgi:colanic acid/amylovoran biosynthesis glycosyltransferase
LGPKTQNTKHVNFKSRIAYLAPEIPAISATFVYNEILHLEKNHLDIAPISVHYPVYPAKGNGTAELREKTHYLYGDSKWLFILSNIKNLLKRPLNYLHTLLMALHDSIKMGIFSRIGMGILYRFIVASRLSEIITKSRCRHLHSQFAHIPTDIAMYASRLSGIPFSFTSHANDIFERGWLLREKVERARFSITISQYNRDFLLKKGAPKEKIHVIHCGVNTASFTGKRQKSIHRIPRIGTLGRMVEKKGFDDLIQACDILKRQGETFHLEIVGDGPLCEELKRLVLSHNLSGEVSFKGLLPHGRVPTWLREQDIFVLPCKKDKKGDMDGIPVVLMEAMALGVPVISTKISGIPELIEDGKSGLLVDPNSENSLANSIKRLLADTDLRNHIIHNGIHKLLSEFDQARNIKKIISLFNEVIP